MEVCLWSTCPLCFPQCTQMPALSLPGTWGHQVTASLSSLTRTLHSHPPALLPCSSGLGVWSLLAAGIPALCERCLLWMGPWDVPCAWCCSCTCLCLCSAPVSLSPVLSGGVSGFHSLLLLSLLCSGAFGSCFAVPGCCWTLFQCLC